MKSPSFRIPFAILALSISVMAGSLVSGQETAPAIQKSVANTVTPKLQFSFDGAEWKTVLDWLASESKLTLVVDALPPGQFNFSDQREYNPDEAIDVVNSWLVTRNFVLLRNGNLLVLLNLENEVPPNLVREVSTDQLGELGSYAFARCTFAPQTLTIDQVKEEFTALLGDHGQMIVLPNTGRLVVTDMVSQLRTMQKVLGDLESNPARGGVQADILPLEHITPEDAMLTIRQIYQIPEEAYATEDGELRFSVDPTGRQLIVRAKADKTTSVRDLLKLIDVPIEGEDGDAVVLEDPEFRSYSIRNSEPAIVLKVMQTMLAGQTEVRLDVSEETSMLFALARPEDHDRIQATLENMQGQSDKIEIFPLEILDADLAKTRIEALIGTSSTDEEGETTYEGPRIIADATRRQLIVRGDSNQIDMIRSFLEKMGESPDAEGREANLETIRVVPMDGVVTKAVLERAMEIWPTMRSNRIKMVIPETADGAVRTEATDEPAEEAKKNEDANGGDAAATVGERKTVKRIVRPVSFLAQVAEEATEEESDEKTTPKTVESNEDKGDLPAIMVTPGSGGLVIASDDTEALDEFEELVRLLSDPYLFPASDTIVFPLKYAKADQAKSLLDQLLGGGSSDGGLDDLMGLGSLLGDTAGAVTITTDSRLNLLFVQAEPIDVDKVEQLIKVIDQPESPIKVETRPLPRVIPLRRADAVELAKTLQEAFPSQAGAAAGGGGNQAIQQLIQQIGGGGGRGPGGGGRGGPGGAGGAGQPGATSSGPEIAIAADQRSNSLVVVAPDQIFEEIEKLAQYLDDTATESTEVTLVVPVTRANPEAIQTALNSVFGQQVVAAAAKTSTPGAGGSAGGSTPGGGNPSGGMSPEAVKAIQERIQRFREAAGGRGGPGGGRGGASGGRGGPGGGRGGPGGGGRGR